MDREHIKANMMYGMLLYIIENSDEVRGFLKSHGKITSRIVELVDTIDRDKTFNKLFKNDDNSRLVQYISSVFDEMESALLTTVKELGQEEGVN